MARDNTGSERDQEASLLDRRSYLQFAGAAAASVAGFGTASATSQSEDTLLYEDFSTEEYPDKFTSAYRQGDYDERVSSPAISGGNSLRVNILEGNHYGMLGTYDPVEAGDVDSELTELYASYWVYIPGDFDATVSNGKLPGPANTEPGGGKGGEPSTGTNGWSARGRFEPASNGMEILYYCYHMDMSGKYGDHIGGTTVPCDEWVKVGQHIKLNTVSGGTANHDGRLRMWVNDELIADKSGMRFTEDLSLGCNYRFNIYYGGGDPSPKDQEIYFDSWALSDSQLPDLPEAGQEIEGKVLELITSDGMPTTDYQFTVEGTVKKRTDAGWLSSESNDSITDNGDGTVTVTGAVGNGYGDSYYVDGTIRSMSDLDESKWTIRYDDEEVSIDDIVEPSGPVIDRFETSKSQQLGDDRMFSVQWAVSGNDQELDIVEVAAVKDTTTDMDFSVTNVSSKSASGWELFQFPVGTELDVTLRARDAAENVTKETKSITL